MGLETNCTARFGKLKSAGKALLETDYLYFKGDFKIKAEFKTIKSIKAEKGILRVELPDGILKLELGDAAGRWLDKIRNPKTVIEKLGVKSGMSVLVSGVTNEEFVKDLEKKVQLRTKNNGSDYDLIFFGASEKSTLNQMKGLSKKLQQSGALWIVYPKGKKEISENDVLAAGKIAELVDVKVVRFSETHTALKFVIPVAQRK